jgi:N-acetylmuramoyl-L-alanine amidase
MADTDVFSDREIIARTIYGEARGEPDEGKLAIANVIMNRAASGVKWWGDSPRSICLAPWQFSCWNRNDPNRTVILSVTPQDEVYAFCLGLADQFVSRALVDNTGGATNYYSKELPVPPAWADDRTPTAEIGNHIFFRIV